ncbi:hypothetical protein SAMN02799625_04670 [Methylobacterium sp. UNC300MFChir4.1]|uniref:hypothetical protein n=1 Tax=Methylobacterium sp. UNC300MFChir4.1 TaxID=1502747 RepID=UPI0008B71E4B|nr:hypothetical protein [Methylobacterium sp. UNC300MFChir4.1]SEP09862.1 hypothetical protein SAMN02799625_04670 [Methylobacterium sp. UNC300MFChir4.1]
MGIFDALTGDAYSTANRRNQYALATGQQQGGSALMNSGQSALQYLLGAPGQAGSLQVLDRGYDQAGNALTSGYADTRSTLGALQSLYEPMASAGKGAFDLYNDAIGANGTGGQARATAAFQTDPGYQFSMNQALGAVQRSAASRGGLAGGNATAGILNTATGLADQAYGQFVNRLGQGAQAYGQGVQGQAGALGALANASQGYGNASAGLATGRGAALSGTLGQAAGVQQGIGQGIAGLTNSTTNALVNSNDREAQGQTQASGNALGALFGVANLAAGGLGGAGGISSLGNVFSGGASPTSLMGRAGSGLANLFGYSPIPRF